jgi:hypothetical protein
MTLTVAMNSTYSSMVNISGVDLEFEVSVTGTFPNRVDIKATGALVDVWMSTGSIPNMCNIKWILSYVSRNNMDQGFLPDPADPMIYTLNSVTGSMTSELVYSAGAVNVLMTSTSSIYYGSKSSTFITNLYRKGLAGSSSLDTSLVCTGSNQGSYFASVVDGELFGLAGYGTWGDTGNRTLIKYNMNTGKITELYSDTAASAETWCSLTVIGDRGNESLVALSVYLTGGRFAAYVRVFDATDGSLIRKTAVQLVQTAYGTNTYADNYVMSPQIPQIYSGSAVFPCWEEWSHSPNIPYESPDFYHFTGVLVYDVGTGSYVIARILNNRDLFRSINMLGVGIDYETGFVYWLEIQTEPTHTPQIEEYRIYKAHASSISTVSLVRTLTKDEYIEFVTGKTSLYGINYSSRIIEKMSTGANVGGVPLGVPVATSMPWYAHQLDETDQRVWFTCSGSVYGASVISEVDKIITTSGGIFVDSPITSMNLVKNGVVFTSASKLGLAQK